MPKKFQLSHLTAGFTAVLVGYTSSVVIVMQAASATGAQAEHITSWLLMLGMILGFSTIAFSWYFKQPILTAWSTPGAAMLITSASGYTMQESIGAFIVTGGLISLTGLVAPINRLLSNIPPQIATSMLAAILLPFCLRAFTSIEESTYAFFAMFIAYMIGKLVTPRYTMLILLIVGIVSADFFYNFELPVFDFSLTEPIWVTPTFSLAATINIALPLYIVTMLSQNLPGIAMISSHGYKLSTSPIFLGTGLANMIGAPFGGFSANLAAITAAICMGEEVDEDKGQRYRAALWAGFFYLVAGCWASSVVTLFLSLPNAITHMLAGFALFGTLLMCLQTSFSKGQNSDSALLTFLITLSDISFMGISAPILGLIAGLSLFKIQQRFF